MVICTVECARRKYLQKVEPEKPPPITTTCGVFAARRIAGAPITGSATAPPISLVRLRRLMFAMTRLLAGGQCRKIVRHGGDLGIRESASHPPHQVLVDRTP